MVTCQFLLITQPFLERMALLIVCVDRMVDLEQFNNNGLIVSSILNICHCQLSDSRTVSSVLRMKAGGILMKDKYSVGNAKKAAFLPMKLPFTL